MKLTTFFPGLCVMSGMLVILIGCPVGGMNEPPPEPPQVLSVSPAGLIGSAGETVRFAAAIAGQVDSYAWTFESALPLNSSDPAPEVLLESPGDFAGSLVVTGEAGISEPYTFNYSIGESGAPTWARFSVQQAGTDAATQVRAGLFENSLVVIYSTVQSTQPAATETHVAVSTALRPERDADWTTYRLGERAALGKSSMVSLHGRPLIEFLNTNPPASQDKRKMLWGTVPVPMSASEWIPFEVFNPTKIVGPETSLTYKSLVPLSNGGFGVAAHSSFLGDAYWITTMTLPPASDGDWSYIELEFAPSQDYSLAEIDGGLSLASGGSAQWASVSWVHAPTLTPGSFDAFEPVTFSNGIIDRSESQEQIAGFTVLADRAMLIVTFGNGYSETISVGRHEIITKQFPILPPALGYKFNAFVTGPVEERWDLCFFNRSILWEGRLLGHLYAENQLYLIRGMTELPDGPEDFESYGLVPNLDYNFSGEVESLALTPLADGGVAVLTCARPGDPPQPLEIWYPDGRW